MRRALMVLLLVVGCEQRPPENLDQTLHRTVVIGDADGQIHVYESTITRREQLAEIDQRRRLLASGASFVFQDPNCVGSDMWLFDQIALNGNEICFGGLGTADLRAYTRIPGVATWAGGVRSFFAGTWGG